MVTIRSYSSNHIDCDIKWNSFTWRFTGVYGYPETGQKKLDVGSNSETKYLRGQTMVVGRRSK